MDNANTKEYLDKIRSQVIENLKRTAFAPSVQMTDVPREPLVEGMDDEADAILDDLDEDENKDKRYTKRRFDQYIEKTGELSDSEDEEELAANGVRRQPAPKRRNHANYRHLDVADSGVESGIATPREASSAPDEDMDTTADGHADKAEAPATTVEQPASSEAKPAPKPDEEPAAESKEAAPEGTGQAVSSPMTVLTYVSSDVDMEDAGAAPQEPEQPPAAAGAAAAQEKTPPASPPQEPAATEQPAPAERSASPATEAPQPTEAPAEATGEPSVEKPKETEAAAPAAETEVKAEQQPEKEKEKEEASEPKEPAKSEES